MSEIQKYDEKTGEVTVARAAAESREVERIRASMTLAKQCPRDEMRAWEKVGASCRRLRFAESATYTYQRGGSPITGPSIRLAEELARAFGNLDYGFHVVDQGDDWSDVECFCHDYESNTRVSRRIRVRHYRDTRSGPRRLTAERDIYELTASYAQRRVRACILELIPSDIVEDAVELCETTMRTGDNASIEVRRRKMIDAFAALSIDVEALETRQGKASSVFDDADLADLRGVYNALRNGEGKREDYFDLKKPVATAAKIEEDLVQRLEK